MLEEIFRLLKSEGINIERAQLETGSALKKLALIGLIAAWHIMSLKLAYDHKDEHNPAAILLTDKQIKLLQILLTTVEGKTKKQQNPFIPFSLAWAAWIVSRLGGWSGYVSQAKAGYLTFKQGDRDFNSKYQVFEAIINVYKE